MKKMQDILAPRHASNYESPIMYPSDITDQSSANPKKPNHTSLQQLSADLSLAPSQIKKVNGKFVCKMGPNSIKAQNRIPEQERGGRSLRSAGV